MKDKQRLVLSIIDLVFSAPGKINAQRTEKHRLTSVLWSIIGGNRTEAEAKALALYPDSAADANFWQDFTG
jgi:hypothetical protein